LMQSDSDESEGQLSPDGRWLAYSSNETGALEVYVQPYPISGAKWQVSREGGGQPQWRADGKELYYLAPDRGLMAVEVNTDAGFQWSVAVRLFRLPTITRGANDYVVARDGRFLVNVLQQATGTTMTVVTDWRQRLK
jgi:Tol biopolymer transport system component